MTPASSDLPNRLRTETFVRTVEHLAETESTNDIALARADSLAAEQLPALVLADRQTAGRGRGGNSWWSAEGSLTFSLLMEPSAFGLPRDRWPALSLTTGAAVATALSKFAGGADVRLKWPNDVFLDGRKVSGILIEAPPSAPGRLVIGIGINVRVPFHEAPPDIRTRAVSLHEAAAEIDRDDVLIAVLQTLEDFLSQLAAGESRLSQTWRRLCLLTGQSVVIEDVGRTISGTCLGIDDDGALRIQTGVSIERLFSGIVTSWSTE